MRHKLNSTLSVSVLILFSGGLYSTAFGAQTLSQPQKVYADRSYHAVGDPADSTDPLLPANQILKVEKTLAAKQPFYLYAKGVAASNTTNIQMMGLRINCLDDYLWSTRNHEGSDAYTSTTTPGSLQLEVRYLFVPSAAGKYTCTLQAQNIPGTGASSSDSWTLQAGGKTYLSTDSNVDGANAWGTEYDDSDYKLAEKAGRLGDSDSACVDTLGDPIDEKKDASDANTTQYCKKSVHVGPGLPAGISEYALRSDRWIPAAGVTKVKAMGDIELTVCYYNTGSCPKYAWGASGDKASGSVVNTRLVVTQFPIGSSTECSMSSFPFQRTPISSSAHHLKVYHTQDISVDTARCGANVYFKSKIEVNWVNGNPVRIEGSHYSQNILMNQ